MPLLSSGHSPKHALFKLPEEVELTENEAVYQENNIIDRQNKQII